MYITINQNTPLYAGSILTLTCTVTLDPYVDESGNIIVAIEWSSLRNISGNRYSITPTVNSNSIYTSNFTISHLETQDSGIYTCTVTVTGGQYVQQTNASDSISITVNQKKIPSVYIHLTPSHPSPYMECFPFCVVGDSVVPIVTPVGVVAVVLIITITVAFVSIAALFLKNRHGNSSTGK